MVIPIFLKDGGSERIYKDTAHVHEGCDIMAGNNERGYFPIVSMTDGVVERIGWLEKGGYRIGIRSLDNLENTLTLAPNLA